MDAASQDALVAVNVVDRTVGKDDVVGNHLQRIVTHLVGAAQSLDVGMAIEYKLACQIDGIKGPYQSYGSHTMSVYMTYEAAGEGLGKVEVSAIGPDSEVDVVALWRHISVDICFGFFSVVCYGVYVNLLLLAVPFHFGVQCAHASFFKLELLDNKVGVGL